MAHATIRDVAREAGVSVASVSRALNGHDSVTSALRERVRSATDRLGYVPHVGARSLSMARTHAIGVMLPDLHGEFFSELVRGIDRAAGARGLQLLLSNMHADLARATQALRAMRGRVDGLVVMAPDLDVDALLGGMPASMPAVLVNCADNRLGRPEIRVQNASAAAVMVDHLVAGGRRAIVHLSGPPGNHEARERLRGYADAMARHGLTPDVIDGDFSEAAGTRAAAVLLARPARCDALFAANDMMAVAALVALRDAGVAVPDAIAVGGFDDVPLARLFSPALTTMRVDIAEIGARAVERLAAIIGSQGEDTSVEPRHAALVVRRTTAGPAGTIHNNKNMEQGRDR